MCYKLGMLSARALFLLVLAISLAGDPAAFAQGRAAGAVGGGSTGGGGAGKLSDGAVRFLDRIKAPTSVILDPEDEPGYAILQQVFASEPSTSAATVIPWLFEKRSETVVNKVKSALRELTFYLVEGPLPELTDAGTIIFRKKFDGVVMRLAIQFDTERKVLVDRALFERMTEFPRDVAAFFTHEALIRTYWDTGIGVKLESTELIGNFVNVFYEETRTRKLSARVLTRYLNDMKIWAAPEKLENYRLATGMHSMEPEVVGKEFVTYYRQKPGILYRYRSLGAYRYYGAAIERGKIYQMDVEQLVDGHRIPRAFHYFVDYRDWFFCLAIMPEDQSEYSGQQTEVAFLIRADQYPR